MPALSAFFHHLPFILVITREVKFWNSVCYSTNFILTSFGKIEQKAEGEEQPANPSQEEVKAEETPQPEAQAQAEDPNALAIQKLEDQVKEWKDKVAIYWIPLSWVCPYMNCF